MDTVVAGPALGGGTHSPFGGGRGRFSYKILINKSNVP